MIFQLLFKVIVQSYYKAIIQEKENYSLFCFSILM